MSLPPRNVDKHGFLAVDIWPEKGLVQKAATIKKLKYLSLGKELKAQTEIARKQ